MKVEVTWKSGGKDVKVTMDCDTALRGWAEACAKKTKEAVDALQKLFPKDKETQHGD